MITYRYTGPVQLTRSCTLRAVAVDAEGNIGDLVEVVYMINIPMAGPHEVFMGVSACSTRLQAISAATRRVDLITTLGVV